MATIICPVANCGKEIPVNSRSKGFRHVPAGWYYSFTGTNVTFGTPTVEVV